MALPKVTDFVEGVEFVVDDVLTKVKPRVILIGGAAHSTREKFERRVLEDLVMLGFKGCTMEIREILRKVLEDVTLSFFLLDYDGPCATADSYVKEQLHRSLDLRVYVGGMPNDNREYDLIVPTFR